MHSARLLTVLVALLVVLAGCTGADVGNGGADDGDANGDTGGDGGAGTSGGSADLEDPEVVLREAGSFTTTLTLTSTDADGVASTLVQSTAVNAAENRSLRTMSTQDGPISTTYTAGDTTFSRFGEGDEVTYQTGPAYIAPMDRALAQAAFAYADIDEENFVGSDTFDGVAVDRYEYRDPVLWRQFGTTSFGDEENVTVTDFTLVVLVDEDGLARQTAWTLLGETEDGREVSVEWRFEVTGVGSTTVDEPDWLAEAESNARLAR
jgi:hypothetical protein